METLKLFDCQPDKVGIDSHIQLILQRTRRLGSGGLPIAVVPNESGGTVEAMRFVSSSVIDESFVIQFTDHEVVLARTWQHCSAFHFQNSSVLSWQKLLFITPVCPDKSIGITSSSRLRRPASSHPDEYEDSGRQRDYDHNRDHDYHCGNDRQ